MNKEELKTKLRAAAEKGDEELDEFLAFVAGERKDSVRLTRIFVLGAILGASAVGILWYLL